MEIRRAHRKSLVGIWTVFCLLIWGCSVSEAHADSSIPRPQWIKRVGNYRLVKWFNPYGNSYLGETLIIRDAKNREVVRLKDHRVDFLFSGDLTGDGFPEIILQTYYVGMHSSIFYYIYSLGPSPRCLLKYDKDNYDSGEGLLPDFWPKDLDGNGTKEIVSWFDGFAYGGLDAYECSASYAGSARVPLVFEFRGGRYREATSKYRPFLNKLLTRVKALMHKRYKEVGAQIGVGDAFQTVLQCYVVLYRLNGPKLAKRRLGAIMPRASRGIFNRHSRQFDSILASRKERYAYPRVYTQKVEMPNLRAYQADNPKT